MDIETLEKKSILSNCSLDCGYPEGRHSSPNWAHHNTKHKTQ